MKNIQIFLLLIAAMSWSSFCNAVRLKDIARIQDEEKISLIGYGIVVGLGGTGDSSRNKVTVQSIKNTLQNFGLSVSDKDISGRNVAAVMVTSKISSFSEKGDQFDISVSSVGDARSLTGGTLLMTPLYGVNEKIYAFAQGQLTVGGYDVEQDLNSIRKNHATVGRVVKGAVLERQIDNDSTESSRINIVLNNPDYGTAAKIVESIKHQLKSQSVKAVHPGKVVVEVPTADSKVGFVARLENIDLVPDQTSKVVINEKTGTIVAGTDLMISAVTIAHGDLRIEIDRHYSVSQPTMGFISSQSVKTAIVPEVNMQVNERDSRPISLPDGTTVSELVMALNSINLSTRDIISILQSIKTAGALHADLVIE